MQTADCAKRHYIRHSTDVPIEVSIDTPHHSHPDTHKDIHTEKGRNISHGGLAFISESRLPIGQTVQLSIRLTRPSFEAPARVAWCHKVECGYEVGVEFLSSETAYRARMVEQVCHIEQYRKEMKEKYGIELSVQEAALAWIKKYAAGFARDQ